MVNTTGFAITANVTDSGEDMTRLTDERIASLARQYLGTCKRVFYTKWKDGIDIEYPTLKVEQFARAIEAELSKQKPVARPRLPRIDHFAREAFEKFASGVECELTNYRWFEAGWDARGDTVAAAPLPSAPDTVQADPMDWPLPCDVRVGPGTHKKGTSLRTLVARMKMLHEAAFGKPPLPEEAAKNLASLQASQPYEFTSEEALQETYDHMDAQADTVQVPK